MRRPVHRDIRRWPEVSDDQAPPLVMVWEGDCFKPPSPFWQKLADKFYVIGAKYRLVEEHERSAKSHRHYFSVIREAWMNMPDILLERFPSPESLRKQALIRCGYSHCTVFPCASAAEARRLAVWAGVTDEFTIIIAQRDTVLKYTAKSQSVKSMGAKDFQASKDATLAWIAQQIGTTKTLLEANVGASEGGHR